MYSGNSPHFTGVESSGTKDVQSHFVLFTEEHAVLEFVSPLLLQTPFGKLLSEVSAERGRNQRDIIMAYVKDFVHTKYLCSRPEKHQVC